MVLGIKRQELYKLETKERQYSRSFLVAYNTVDYSMNNYRVLSHLNKLGARRITSVFQALIKPDLVLRLFELRHTDELAAVLRDNSVHLQGEMDWLAQPFSSADVQMYIQAGLDRFAVNNGFRAGIWWRGQLVGCISLHSVDWNDRKASFGYWLGAGFQGHGIITQSCRAVIAHAFDELQLDRLEIQCAMDNERSRHVAQRLGFQQEGVLRQSWRRHGTLVDQVVYSLLRCEWLASDARGL